MLKINLCNTIQKGVGLSTLLILSTVAIATPAQSEIAKNGFTLNGLHLNGLRSNVITINGLRFNNLVPYIQTLDTVSPLKLGKSQPQTATLNNQPVAAIQLEGGELILHLQSAE